MDFLTSQKDKDETSIAACEWFSQWLGLVTRTIASIIDGITNFFKSDN
jgi:hypothetical protein